MQDVFIEYMVARRKTVKTTLIKALIATLSVLLAGASFLLSGWLGPFSILGALITVGILYGAYYLITSINVEFEYAVTNGEMDVDKIIAKRKRVRLLSVRCKEVEAFGRYDAREHREKSYQNRILACDHPESSDLWYCVSHQGQKGLTLLVFNANDRLLGGIKPFLPASIRQSAFGQRL